MAIVNGNSGAARVLSMLRQVCSRLLRAPPSRTAGCLAAAALSLIHI